MTEGDQGAPSPKHWPRRVAKNGGLWTRILCLAIVFAACSLISPKPDSNLPPSASDLELLGTAHLCDVKDDVVQHWQGTPYHTVPWGSGAQLQRTTPQPPPGHDSFYFFNDDQILVGAVFRFDPALDLSPYPVLRETLSSLTPASIFYLDPTQLLSETQALDAVLYRTGDKTSTTQYLVRERDDHTLLLAASMSLDPYEQMLSSYHEKFLPGLKRGRPADSAGNASSDIAQKEDFLGIQQFARGETALFRSCGTAQPQVAVDAYRQSIQHGLNDKTRFAEAHHRLGLALRDQGNLTEAQQTLEQALSLRPHAPEIVNSLGRVLADQQQWTRARQLFEEAVVLRPNFADARYNLAKLLESRNPRRAIAEYETYLALAEGVPGEAQRVMRVKERVKRLKGE